MSRVVAAREPLKQEYQSSYGVNPTYLAFIAQASVETLKDYPWLNAEIRGESIVTRPWVNLGIAVSLEDGKGLIVPVLRNAQDLNLLGVARAIGDLAARARTKKLLPDDVQGGTFTITNPGGYGTFHGTPIISQPQVGILGTYAVVKRPVGRPGRARRGRDRNPPADEPHPHVRPPARRRRLCGRVPARPARASRGLGAGGLGDERVQTVVPMLAYADGVAAMDWLQEAFGFEEVTRWVDDDGVLSHGELSLRRRSRHARNAHARLPGTDGARRRVRGGASVARGAVRRRRRPRERGRRRRSLSASPRGGGAHPLAARRRPGRRHPPLPRRGSPRDTAGCSRSRSKADGNGRGSPSTTLLS